LNNIIYSIYSRTMTTNILKQVAGIDIAQKELVVTLGKMDEQTDIELFAYKTFPNNVKGFKSLTEWVSKVGVTHVQCRFVMEATGVYHESLAYFLFDSGYEVSILLPNKISNYVKTLDIKTITDKTASQAIARFGLERKLDLWKKPLKVFKDMRQLTRERGQLIVERTILKNQLHAEQAEAMPNYSSINRVNERIALLDKQEKAILVELATIIKQEKKLADQVKNITSIPGVGKITAVIVLAETNGFELIRNKKQLVSYAGLDIKEKLSGTSVKGKPKISKKGNKHLRHAMHLPALSAIQHNERFKAIFVRLVSKHGIKMKAAVAIHRKLLELIYIIWKTNKPFDKNYMQTTIPFDQQPGETN